MSWKPSEGSIARAERNQLRQMPKVKLDNYQERTIGRASVDGSHDLGSSNFGASIGMKNWPKSIQLEKKNWRQRI